jgi:hypothetical protein
LFTVPASGSYRSASIQRKRLGINEYSSRGLTYCYYDLEDFWIPAGTLPHDSDVSFIRVAEISLDGVTVKPEGPILIVPPPAFYTNTRPGLTVQGTAPSVAGLSTGLPPDGSLHFILPKFSDSVNIRNLGGASIFISFHTGLPEYEVPAGQTQQFFDAAMSDVYVRGSGAAIAFSAYFAIVNAEMA